MVGMRQITNPILRNWQGSSAQRFLPCGQTVNLFAGVNNDSCLRGLKSPFIGIQVVHQGDRLAQGQHPVVHSEELPLELGSEPWVIFHVR